MNSQLLVTLLSVGLTVATSTQAGIQLFEGSWSVRAFGNEITGGTGAEEFYSAVGIPFGIQCNPNQPRCPFESTPTDGAGNWSPLGGSPQSAIFCAPWYDWGGYGATVRPAKGETRTAYCSAGCPRYHLPIPPLYRNPNFFTSAGQPRITACTATSTGYTTQNRGNLGHNRGAVQVGKPVTGTWVASRTGTQKGGFAFFAAPKNHTGGIRTTGQIGEFAAVGPYLYSYTYATLRNDHGIFGPGSGPGSFNLVYRQGTRSVASINVKKGVAKFGGTMRMLGALTTKVCFFRDGGCSLGGGNWRYEAIGETVGSLGPVITEGYIATGKTYYYHTLLMQVSTIQLEGARFPWTTGSVTVTATGRGPHETVHYAHGYDNRNSATPSGLGTIQLVTPVLTRWLQPALNFETGGIGILRIKFVPEPRTWTMLVAGLSLLAVLFWMRRCSEPR